MKIHWHVVTASPVHIVALPRGEGSNIVSTSVSDISRGAISKGGAITMRGGDNRGVYGT